MSRRARSPEVGVETNLGLSNMKPNAKSEAKPKLKPKPKTRKTTEIDLEVETVDLGTGATDLIETGIETDIETDIQTETDLGPSKKKRKTTKNTGVDLFNSQQTLAIQAIVAGTIAKLAPTLSHLGQPDATAGVTSGANPPQPPIIWPQLLTTTPQPAPNPQPPFQYWHTGDLRSSTKRQQTSQNKSTRLILRRKMGQQNAC